MTPWPLAALAAALLASPAGAAVCLVAGSMGPDVPGCTPASDAKEQEGAIGQNLLALAGQAAAEQFSEREAIDAAGPLLPRSASGKSKDSPRLRSTDAGLTPMSSLLAPLKDAKNQEYEALAGAIVRGTGDSFSQLEVSHRKPAALPAALSVSRSLSSTSAPPAPGSAPTPRAEKPTFGPAIRDEGRGAFDGSSMALPDDVGGPGPGPTTATPANPRSPTTRQCTITNPCPTAD